MDAENEERRLGVGRQALVGKRYKDIWEDDGNGDWDHYYGSDDEDYDDQGCDENEVMEKWLRSIFFFHPCYSFIVALGDVLPWEFFLRYGSDRWRKESIKQFSHLLRTKISLLCDDVIFLIVDYLLVDNFLSQLK